MKPLALPHSFGFLAVAALALFTAAVSAEPLPRIAIVRDANAGASTLQRLRAELESIGLEVIEISAEGQLFDRESLEQAARALGASAAVRIIRSRGIVELLILDRASGKFVLREFAVPPNEPVDELVAVRAGELLRASLIELGLPEARSDEVKPPRAVKQQLPAPRPVPVSQVAVEEDLLTLGAGPLVAFSAGGVGPGFELRFGARFSVTKWLGAHAMALVPTFPATIEAREGSAEFSFALFAAGLDVSLLPLRASWRARAGLSGALLHLRVVGAAEPPFGATTEEHWLGAALGRFELTRALSRNVWLGAELMGGIAPRSAAIRFAGREVASFGEPLGAVGLVLEVALP